MEVGGQLHASTVMPTEKVIQVLIERGVEGGKSVHL